MFDEQNALVLAYEGFMDGRATFRGDNVKVLTGYEESEFDKDVLWTDLIIPEDRQSAKKAFVLGLKGDKSYTRQYRIRTKNGGIRHILEFSQIIMQKQDPNQQNVRPEVDRIWGSIVDITEKKMAEANQQRLAELSGKYLMVSLGSNNQDFGFPIKFVKEIVSMLPIRKLPEMSGFAKGVINLRGHIIPIIDLAQKIGLKSSNGQNTCIVILEIVSMKAKKCWEVKGCHKPDCPAYESLDLRCWILSGTHCRGEIQGSFHKKIDACSQCEVYQHAYEEKTVFTAGIIANSVQSAIHLSYEAIELNVLNSPAVLGMAKINDSVKIILSLDRIITAEETQFVQAAKG